MGHRTVVGLPPLSPFGPAFGELLLGLCLSSPVERVVASLSGVAATCCFYCYYPCGFMYDLFLQITSNCSCCWSSCLCSDFAPFGLTGRFVRGTAWIGFAHDYAPSLPLGRQWDVSWMTLAQLSRWFLDLAILRPLPVGSIHIDLCRYGLICCNFLWFSSLEFLHDLWALVHLGSLLRSRRFFWPRCPHIIYLFFGV